MEIPESILAVLRRWETEGVVIESSPCWTTALRRHVGCLLNWHGSGAFAKLAIAKQRDLDEPDMISGIRREVWWSEVVHALQPMPFTSPRVLASNTQSNSLFNMGCPVAWIVTERVVGHPWLEIDSNSLDCPTANTNGFASIRQAIVNALLSMDSISPQAESLPDLPAPPHGMRRWKRKGYLDMSTAVLGNGAFEMKNFWRDSSGRLVILDNEFAGWYPRYDSLSYLFHRLYCNCMRPDLAGSLLNAYRKEAVEPGSENDFVADFCRILRPRVLGGIYYDGVRRHLPPWHSKQRLRYRLLWEIVTRDFSKLCTASH